MYISPKEVMIGCIVSYQGQPHIVKAVSQFIMLEGHKEWIGGSQMEGEPLTLEWLDKFGFEYRSDAIPKRWNKKMVGQGSTWHLYEGLEQGSICFSPVDWNYTLKLDCVHQLQVLCFSFTREHLKLPKLK